jgi:hypothetical protein
MALPCRVSAEGQVASGCVGAWVRACFPVELSNLLPQGLEVRERIGGLGVGRRRRTVGGINQHGETDEEARVGPRPARHCTGVR